MKLAELVTEIRVDSKGAQKGLDRFRKNLKETEQTLARVGKIGLAAFTGLGAAIGYTVKLASTQQDAENGLKAALKATGQEVDKNFLKLSKQAAALQKVTTAGDEATMSVQALGINMGIQTDQIDKATRYAYGLEKAFGLDVKMAMRGVALAMQGNYDLLNRYIPALRTAANQEEKHAAFVRAATAGFKQKTAETQTLSGKLTQLGNTLGDIGETIGTAFLPHIQKAAEAAQEWIRSFGGTDGVKAAMDSLVSDIKDGLNILQIAFEEAMAKDWLLAANKSIEDAKFLFFQFVDDISSFDFMDYFNSFLEEYKGIEDTLYRIRDTLKEISGYRQESRELLLGGGGAALEDAITGGGSGGFKKFSADAIGLVFGKVIGKEFGNIVGLEESTQKRQLETQQDIAKGIKTLAQGGAGLTVGQ